MRVYNEALPEKPVSLDVIGMTCHGFAMTRVDALCHYFTPLGPVFTPTGRQGMYDGYPVDDISDSGVLKLGIEHVVAPWRFRGATGAIVNPLAMF